MNRSLQSYLSGLQKFLGDDQYSMCRNIDEMILCKKPLRLGLREKQSGVFKRTSYTNKLTEFTLGDVLVASGTQSRSFTSLISNNDDLFTVAQEVSYGNSRSNSAFKVGVEILPESIDGTLDFKNSSSTSISSAVLKFGEINKRQDIIEEMQSQWRFNRAHPLWQRITDEKKHCEPFFIIGIVFTDTAIDLQYDNTHSCEILIRSFEALRMHSETKEELQIPKGSGLAYKVQKIKVKSTDGSINLDEGTMSDSGLTAQEDFGTLGINLDEIKNCRTYYSKYFGKLPIEKQRQFRDALKINLLQTAILPSHDTVGKNQDFKKMEDTDEGLDCRSTDDGTSNFPILGLLMEMVMNAFPTTNNPKDKEIADLLQKMGISWPLGLPENSEALYGIRYFLEALLCLPPKALRGLRDCANEGEEQKVVEELERLLHCVVEQQQYSVNDVAPNVRMFFSLAFLYDEESFLYAWRAAYVSAIYLWGF